MKFFPKIKRGKQYQLLTIIGICLLCAGLFVAAERRAQEKIENKDIAKTENDSNTDKSKSIDHYETMTMRPVSVMIDNQTDARPNYGLGSAQIIYETLAEGGTTRFLGVFSLDKNNEDKLEKIGPVRSSRPYFVEINQEYYALHAHAGGSPDALRMIKNKNVYNLEEISGEGPEYFWRVYSREAPHNLFTSEERLINALEKKEIYNEVEMYNGWRFCESDKSKSLEDAREIKISFSVNSNYDASFQYNTKENHYERYQAGKKHTDALDDRAITTENIIIQYVNTPKVLDGIGRLDINLDSQGEAIIFRDGKKIHGVWRKDGNRTIFVDYKGDKICLLPGKVWVAIVPQNRSVEFSK